MGILFKTYNGRHQLHICRESWVVPDKAELDNILRLFQKKELPKAKIVPKDDSIEIELNGLIVDCRDLNDLKRKFGMIVDLKSRFQKVTPAAKPARGRPAPRKK